MVRLARQHFTSPFCDDFFALFQSFVEKSALGFIVVSSLSVLFLPFRFRDLDGVQSTPETDQALVLIDTAGCDIAELDVQDEMSKGNEGLW